MKTRSVKDGKEKYLPKTTHYGRYAMENATLPGQRKYQPCKKKKDTKQITRSITMQQSIMRKPAPVPGDHSLSIAHRSNTQIERRITRNTEITCLTYGKYRKLLFPGYKFCSKCDNWENDHLLMKNIKRGSRNYKCESKHSNPLFPTERITPYCQNSDVLMNSETVNKTTEIASGMCLSN